MTEYDVKKALHKRGGQVNSEASSAQSVNGIPNSVLADVFAGKRGASDEMMGHRAALAPSIAAKMSRSFGMDVSAVQVYRSDAMAGTEMHGMAQGNKVVLSSDVDLNTLEGQAVLGHELSHIRAQSMGMGSGRGLLQNGALERQADTEGMLAARGMSLSGETLGMSMGLGMAGMEGLTPLGGGLSASAAAPMQAAKGDKEAKEKAEAEALSLQETEEMQDEFEDMSPEGHYEGFLENIPWLMGSDDYTKKDYNGNCMKYFDPAMDKLVGNIGEERYKTLDAKVNGAPDMDLTFSPVDGKQRWVNGLNTGRIAGNFKRFWAAEHSDAEIVQLLLELTAGSSEIDKDGNIVSIEGGDPLNPKHDEAKMRGVNRYKNILYWKLKQIESEFGTTLTQMHPRDIINRMGAKKIFYYAQVMQDAQQLVDNNDTPETKQLMAQGSDDPQRDAEMRKLLNYYNLLFAGLKTYPKYEMGGFLGASQCYVSAKQNVRGIGGPRMNEKQLKKYNKMVEEKIDSGEYEALPEDILEQDRLEEEKLKERMKSKNSRKK